MSRRKQSAVDALNLNPDEKEEFDKYVEAALNARGVTTPQQQRVVLLELVEAAKHGTVPTSGKGHAVINVDTAILDFNDPDTIEAAAGKKKESRIKPAEWAMILAALAFLFYWMVFSGGDDVDDAEASEQSALSLFDVTDTPEPTAIPTNAIESFDEIVSDSGVRVAAYTPNTLQIGNNSYVIYPIEIEQGQGDWQLPPAENTVTWVYGTLVNYVFSVLYTEANAQLLEQLQPGDPIIIRLSTGDTRVFQVADSIRVSKQEVEVFTQDAPGVSIVLVDDPASDRLVVRGVYQAAGELGAESVGVVNDEMTYNYAETARISGVADVNISDIRQGEPLNGVPTMLISVGVQNNSPVSLFAENFLPEIRDAAGNRYQMNDDVAAAIGAVNFQGEIAPNFHYSGLLAFAIDKPVPPLTLVLSPVPGQTIAFDLAENVPGLTAAQISSATNIQIEYVTSEDGVLKVEGVITSNLPYILGQSEVFIVSSDTKLVPQAAAGATGLPLTIAGDGSETRFSFFFLSPLGAAELNIGSTKFDLLPP